MVDVAWVALSLIQGIGGATLRALLQAYPTPTDILRAPEADLCRVKGIGKKTAHAIQQIDLPHTQQQILAWQARGVQILALHDAAYPARLRKLADAPPTLFVRGEGALQVPKQRHVAIVGTRNPSANSSAQAYLLGATAATCGAVVVSGLALGVDAAAHEGALSVAQSRAIGVLGSGVLRPFPPQNAALIEAVRLYGALVCEVSPQSTVSTTGLVARNRIISGLADALIVVETAADGGAMYAARAAVRQGRALYVIDNDASGNRQLLAEGVGQALDFNALEAVFGGG